MEVDLGQLTTTHLTSSQHRHVMQPPMSSGSLAPQRRTSLLPKRRPVTSYNNDAYYVPEIAEAMPDALATRTTTRFGYEGTRWKERRASFLDCDRTESLTRYEAGVVNTPTVDRTIQTTRSARSASSHLSCLKDGLLSFGRRMSISLRPKSDKNKVNISKVSAAPASSSDAPNHAPPMHSKQKQSRWFRSSRPARRRPSLPSFEQAHEGEPARYNFRSPPIGNDRPPVMPVFHMHTGAAARAAAAAQNEAFHSYQKSAPVFNAGMSRLMELKLRGDSESGIGIDLQDQRESYHGRVDVIRQDPARVLPVELMEQILCCLDPSSLMRVERVCRNWRLKAKSRHVWRLVFQREYDCTGMHRQGDRYCPQPARGIGKGVVDQDWQKMYHIRRRIDRRWADGTAAAIYLNGHKDSVYCVQFDEHKIITGSRDRTVRVWDTHTFQCIRKIGPPSQMANLAPDAATSTLHPPGAFYIQNTSSIDPSGGLAPLDYHDASILCLQFDAEIMVTGSSDNSAIVWSIQDNYRPVRRLRGHFAGVLDVCIDRRYIITCSKDTTICLWDRATGELIKKLTGHRGPVNAVQMRGNLLASASGDGMAKLWNLTDGQCVKEFSSRDRGLACVEFSEDGRTILAGGNDQVIYEYDTNSGDLVRELVGHQGLVRSLHLDTSHNRVVSGSYDMSVKVWDGRRGRTAEMAGSRSASKAGRPAGCWRPRATIVASSARVRIPRFW
ncbi:F-box/WD repeat-containing protein [bacterium]|nr:F-box/WD repeat-containing protein [bacterium]